MMHNADALISQITRHRKCHRRDCPLTASIGNLAQLSVESPFALLTNAESNSAAGYLQRTQMAEPLSISSSGRCSADRADQSRDWRIPSLKYLPDASIQH
jgi:hypothetical protein